MKLFSRWLAVMAIVAFSFSVMLPANAQVDTDQGATDFTILSEGGYLVVEAFDITFGNVGSSPFARTFTGYISGDIDYISVHDTVANTLWYVTIDATDLTRVNDTVVLPDNNVAMTSYGGDAAVTLLSGTDTTEIVGVIQTGVTFDGVASYSIMERTAFTSGIIGRYGIVPNFRLYVPGYTSLGSYVGTLELSLYTS